ncbi:MAG TPA: hypothetical protein VGM39_18355 [Kofleriaceae bacterium]|jgi:hypothetical protein
MTVDEWDYRALCPDGGCTGVIGSNGQCKTCGRAAQNWGDERKRGMRNPTDPPPIDNGTDEPPSELAPASPAKIGASMSAWSSRQLCVDGGCVGLIGADGTCGECGKPGAVVAKGTAETEEYEASDDDSDEDDDAEETGADADEAQAEDDEGEGDDDDEDSDDDDDDESDDDDDEDEEPDDEEDNDTIHASSADGVALAARSNASLDAPADALEAPPERELCPDGACVGVIGADGTCKVCGKAKDAT